ncbi:MAG: hypothetical protein AAF487_11370 [Bacteroidota bacterium]
MDQLRDAFVQLGIKTIGFGAHPNQVINGYNLCFNCFRPSLIRPGIVNEKWENDGKKIISMCSEGNNSYLMNGEPVRIPDLQSVLIEHMQETNYMIHLEYSDTTTFENYFQLLNTAQKSLKSIRDAYSIEKFQVTYEQSDPKEQKITRKAHPFRIREVKVEEN